MLSIISEVAKKTSDVGALEKSADIRGRPFSVLDESFFKEESRSEGLKEVSARRPEKGAPRPFAVLDESFFKPKPPEHITCQNERLEGAEHPVTGVPFERKIEKIDGRLTEVVVPRFDSVFDAELPREMYLESDARQFKECVGQLKEAVGKDPELRSKFTAEQLDQIENLQVPDGYVLHHDAKPGKLQLVDEITHMKTSHSGGRSLWGGGSEHR
jgi:hypothetical protein